MAYRFKWNKFFCFSLSQACFIFGILDLISNTLIIVENSILFHKSHVTESIYFIVVAILSICTCLVMMFGSMKKSHRLLIPHILLKILIIECLAVLILVLPIMGLESGDIKEILPSLIIISLILLISIPYWNVIFCRYLEIKDTKSVHQVIQN